MGHTHSHHDHSHGHSHSHHHPKMFNQAFFISTVANSLFVIIQIIYAFTANSTSLLADAIHNLGDVLSLILAWAALRLGQSKPTAKTTYGMKKTSILAALINGILLVFSCGIIATEAMYKLFAPTEVASLSVIVVASIGILVNGGTALLFIRGQNDLNIRGAFLHLLYDALISVGVVIAGALMYGLGWYWIDPVVGLLIAIIILKGTWQLFSDSFRLIIDAVPREISLNHVHEFLLSEPGVQQVHDLHIWALSTHENALSAHLWMPEQEWSDQARQQLIHVLKEKYNIHHVTIQVEKTLDYCDDACAAYK